MSAKKVRSGQSCAGCGRMVWTWGTGNFMLKAWHAACLKKDQRQQQRSSLTVAEAGKLGGLKGGQSRSAAKVAAGRKNAAKARKVYQAWLKVQAEIEGRPK